MKDETLLAQLGRRSHEHHGAVNPPVYRASTILFRGMAAREEAVRNQAPTYGLGGTPTTFALEEAVAALEHGEHAVAVGSGLAAVTVALLAFLEQGDHLLMPDSVYGPSRSFADRRLRKLGIETSYYDPTIGAGIAELMRESTKLVFLESPGSLTFEMQDVPAIVAAAKARGCITVMDNTWASPFFFRPLDHGVDVSVVAGTKFLAGHSDVLMGFVVSRAEHFRRLEATAGDFGHYAAPDECYQCLRGMRTLGVRMPRHQENGLALARWLAGRKEVSRVLHPALPGDPGHDLWRRDYAGAPGLFSVRLAPHSESGLAAMIDGYRLFGLGASWGGYESLVWPVRKLPRSAAPPAEQGTLVRFHAGLEDAGDLIAELEAGFARLARA
jgi:cysteine-S-conjugate beta-lyase